MEIITHINIAMVLSITIGLISKSGAKLRKTNSTFGLCPRAGTLKYRSKAKELDKRGLPPEGTAQTAHFS